MNEEIKELAVCEIDKCTQCKYGQQGGIRDCDNGRCHHPASKLHELAWDYMLRIPEWCPLPRKPVPSKKLVEEIKELLDNVPYEYERTHNLNKGAYLYGIAEKIASLLPEMKLIGEEEREVIIFANALAKVFDKFRDSHVYFYLQRAFPEDEDWEWAQFQELLTRIIKNSGQLAADRKE